MEDHFDNRQQETATPFERFLRTPSLDMLHSALPYVSQTMRKPLALYIKYAEMQRIMQDFDQEEVLSACGFSTNNTDPEAMLKAMKMASSGQPTPQIDSLLNMMNMMRTYRTFNEFMQNNPELMHFLTSMMNQKNATGNNDSSGSYTSNNADNASMPFGNLNPMELLKQLSTGKEGDTSLQLLQELLKNNNLSR